MPWSVGSCTPEAGTLDATGPYGCTHLSLAQLGAHVCRTHAASCALRAQHHAPLRAQPCPPPSSYVLPSPSSHAPLAMECMV